LQYGDLLNNAIKHVCITNNASLPIFGRSDHLCISLYALRSSLDKNHTNARQIDINHCTLHDPSQYTILHHIRINSKIISKNDLYLRRAIGSFGNCIGLLLNFANGLVDLQLTGIFQASRETSFLSLQQATSKIIEANKDTINLTPGPPTIIEPPPQSLRSPTYLSPQGRGRGRNNTRPGHPPPYPNDSSSAHYRISRTSILSIRSNTSHKYYVIIIGVAPVKPPKIIFCPNLIFLVDVLAIYVNKINQIFHKKNSWEVSRWWR